MSLDMSQGDVYQTYIPSISLPPIIEIQTDALPERWAEFCTRHRVRPFAVLAYENPLEQMKVWGASQIIRGGLATNAYVHTDTVIDSTSGNFGEAVAWILQEIRRKDPDFPIKYVMAVVARSTPEAKIERLKARGITPIFAENSIEAMTMARELATKNGWWYLEQYWNPENTVAYHPIARHIAKLRPALGAMACGVGSGGSCSGIMPVLETSLGKRMHRLQRVAVVVEVGDTVDGVRTELALEPGSLPWRRCVDDVRYVGQKESLKFSSALWRQKDSGGAWCEGGPSTGFALAGGLLSLVALETMEKLDAFRNEAGDVELAFLAPDKRTPYRKKYEEKGIYF